MNRIELASNFHLSGNRRMITHIVLLVNTLVARRTPMPLRLKIGQAELGRQTEASGARHTSFFVRTRASTKKGVLSAAASCCRISQVEGIN